MPNIHKAALTIAFALFFLVNILTLKNGHNWGDDFAQYILHAVNLTEHRPYAENIALDLWTVVPPGFPLLLSAVIYWAGINLTAFKFLNLLCWGLAAWAGYLVAVKRMRPVPAAALTIWFLSAPAFFFFKQNVLSDIPFLCFTALSIPAFEKYRAVEEKRKPFFYALAAFLMSCSMLVRWAGVVLFLAVILHLGISREWKKTPGFIAAAALTSAVIIGLGSTPAGHFGGAQYPPEAWLQTVWMNTTLLSKSLWDFMITGPLNKNTGPGMWAAFKILGPVLFAAGAIFFIYRLSQRRISFLGCFTCLYLLGVILWPVQQGLSRYLLPAVFPLAVYFLKAVQHAFKKPAAGKCLLGLFMILTVQNIIVIGKHRAFNDDDIFQKESLEMADWVTDHLAPEERYMFYKPRALRLLTGRTGAAFWVYPEDRHNWPLRARQLNIKYIIADKKRDELAGYNELILPAGNSELRLNTVWENSAYRIFEADP